MVITFHGENCFRVQSGQLSLITNPLPRFKADITLRTASGFESAERNSSTHKLIVGPGEYEIQGVEITGLPADSSAATYLVKMEEMNLCFWSGGEKDQSRPEKLDKVDILFALKEMSLQALKQIQPKIIIPAYRKPADLKSLLKELEQEAEPEDKLTIKKKDLPEKMKVVVLKS